jgi:hypothetical protein
MPKKQKDTKKQSEEVQSEDVITLEEVNEKQPKKFFHWVKRHKKAVLIGTLAAIVMGGGAAMAFGVFGEKPQTTVIKVIKKQPAKPKTVASPLSGVQVSPELAERPITGVVIENHTDARPQSGLQDAGVVYEALAEGGITRFLAFFLDQKPKEIGPVRSVRTYFVDWALEFNAPVAHVGGNIDALDLIGPLHMKNMDQFANGNYFYRTSDRYAPHNMYTTTEKLDALEKKLGYDDKSDFTPSPRVVKEKAAATADHPNIHINYSYNGYQVDYQYTAATNDYARLLAGKPHVDRNTGQQIHVKNVVIQYMPTSYGTTRIGEQTVIMATPGSGKAVVLRDGTAIEGTWNKTAHSSRTIFKDSAGKEIPLNPGNTWYSIVPVGNSVTY